MIDLENCKVIVTEDIVTISHSTGKPIHTIVDQPDSDKKIIEYDKKTVRLKCPNHHEAMDWADVLIRVINIPSSHPITLPRLKTSYAGREEKCHWFNIFMARYFEDMKKSEVLKFLFKRSLGHLFEKIRKPDYLVISSFL